MKIETHERKQRLQNCALLITESQASSEEKAEGLCYIAGYAALLEGLEAGDGADLNSELAAAVENFDEFCAAIEQGTQQGAIH